MEEKDTNKPFNHSVSQRDIASNMVSFSLSSVLQSSLFSDNESKR